MANEKRRRRLEWGKNVLILLLSLSALYLLGRTQLYDEGAHSGQTWLSGFLSALPGQEEPEPSQPVGLWTQGGTVQPVRVVVMGPQGRTGVQYDNATVSGLFQRLTNTLSDALAGASAPEKTTAAKFRAALSAESKNPGVYLDFLGEVPLPNLSAWLTGRSSDLLTASVRRLLLTATDGGEVLLYYINEETGLYYASKTSPDLLERLTQFAAESSPNGAAFAFESGETYAALAPYTLLEGGEAPRPGKYTAADPVPLNLTDPLDQSAVFQSLVRSLSFHPQSTTYRTRDNITIQEGAEKLRVYESGLVTYEASDLEDPRFPVQGGGQTLERWEIVGTAWGFVEQVLTPALCGDARLYIRGVKDLDDGGTVVEVGYQLDGAPVLVGREGYAAQVVVTGGAISSFTLQLRGYAYQEQGPRVLPELQATAALEARAAPEALGGKNELMLYYGDSHGDTVSAAWGAF